MDIEQKIIKVEEAQNTILEAIDLLKSAELGEATGSYVIYHLEILASCEHSHLPKDINLDVVLNELKEEDD